MDAEKRRRSESHHPEGLAIQRAGAWNTMPDERKSSSTTVDSLPPAESYLTPPDRSINSISAQSIRILPRLPTPQGTITITQSTGAPPPPTFTTTQSVPPPPPPPTFTTSTATRETVVQLPPFTPTTSQSAPPPPPPPTSTFTETSLPTTSTSSTTTSDIPPIQTLPTQPTTSDTPPIQTLPTQPTERTSTTAPATSSETTTSDPSLTTITTTINGFSTTLVIPRTNAVNNFRENTTDNSRVGLISGFTSALGVLVVILLGIVFAYRRRRRVGGMSYGNGEALEESVVARPGAGLPGATPARY
ncbi:hypothetical protein DFP72DRAFT_1152877 [Ephemerocybe angulata]|uniref:Uncharacterized protein n=1 Tax=Ephemerocybe angulata TaxID=980116 RepID=A0A8H6LW92_9AGAR|nr:hypothetical protein DFP72DRAFT_1152877 [Tulosesus angulatus]